MVAPIVGEKRKLISDESHVDADGGRSLARIGEDFVLDNLLPRESFYEDNSLPHEPFNEDNALPHVPFEAGPPMPHEPFNEDNALPHIPFAAGPPMPHESFNEDNALPHIPFSAGPSMPHEPLCNQRGVIRPAASSAPAEQLAQPEEELACSAAAPVPTRRAPFPFRPPATTLPAGHATGAVSSM